MKAATVRLLNDQGNPVGFAEVEHEATGGLPKCVHWAGVLYIRRERFDDSAETMATYTSPNVREVKSFREFDSEQDFEFRTVEDVQGWARRANRDRRIELASIHTNLQRLFERIDDLGLAIEALKPQDLHVETIPAVSLPGALTTPAPSEPREEDIPF